MPVPSRMRRGVRGDVGERDGGIEHRRARRQPAKAATCGSGSTTCSPVQTDSKPARSAARATLAAVCGLAHGPKLMPKRPNFTVPPRRAGLGAARGHGRAPPRRCTARASARAVRYPLWRDRGSARSEPPVLRSLVALLRPARRTARSPIAPYTMRCWMCCARTRRAGCSTSAAARACSRPARRRVSRSARGRLRFLARDAAACGGTRRPGRRRPSCRATRCRLPFAAKALRRRRIDGGVPLVPEPARGRRRVLPRAGARRAAAGRVWCRSAVRARAAMRPLRLAPAREPLSGRRARRMRELVAAAGFRLEDQHWIPRLPAALLLPPVLTVCVRPG